MSAAYLEKWALMIVLLLTLRGWGQEPSKEPEAAKPRVDIHGDPLPAGAVARLGTVRFRHPGSVRLVAFSPDGRLIAAVSDGQATVIIWERTTGRKLRTIRAPLVYQLRFSPDSKRLYGQHKTMLVWDVETGAEVKGLQRPPTESFFANYSPDG